jgi:hypothetical protein
VRRYRIARETQIVVSATVVDGTYELRPCFINARTALADVTHPSTPSCGWATSGWLALVEVRAQG